jgi:hypothetical protein
MPQAKEYDIYFAMPFRVKGQFRIPRQVLMNDRNGFSRIALAMDKANVHGRMVDQQPDRLSAGISGATDNACPYSSHDTILRR